MPPGPDKSLIRALLIALSVGAVAGISAGCAGGQLAKLWNSDDAPKELPKDLQEKFEVKEAPPEATAAPVSVADPKTSVVAGAPAKKKIARKGRKGKGAVVPASLAPKAPFAYPNRRPPKDPFWVDELQVFDISYFGVSAGEFSLSVQPHKTINNRKVYHFKGTAVSSKVFSLFYRLNDVVETYVDFEGLFSHRFHLELDESKQTRDVLELSDSEKGEAFYWNRWNRPDQPYIESKEYFAITPFSQDSLSALFFLRAQPLNDGDVVTFPVINEGKTWEAVVTVEGREEMDTVLGRIRVIRLRPEHKYQGVLKRQGDSFIWLSDDDRRFLVKLDAKVKIGSVLAKLKRLNAGVSPQN